MYVCGKFGDRSFLSDGSDCIVADNIGVVESPPLSDKVHLFTNKYIVCGSRLDIASFKAIINNIEFIFKFDVFHENRQLICRQVQNLTDNILSERVGRRYKDYVDFLRLIVSGSSFSNRYRFASYDINDKLKRGVWFRVTKSNAEFCYVLPVPIEFVYSLYYLRDKVDILKSICPLFGVDTIGLEDTFLLKYSLYDVDWRF